MEQLPPFISVIIPTYERAGQLSVCLEAVAAQDYARECFEVLVVDDGSVSFPVDGLEKFGDQLNLRLLKQRHAGPAAARNYGAINAKGAFLAFTDDDCAPDRGWLRNLATRFTSFPDCVLGGRTINELVDNPYSIVSQLLVDYLYTRWNADRATFFASNNLGLPAKLFHAVGGFDVGWTRAAGEDRDLCDRLLARGCQFLYVPDALVRHAHPLRLRTFFQQHFNYGRGAYRLHQRRARREARDIRVEPLAFYLTMLGYPFYRTQYQKAVSLAVLMGIAQLANAIGFWWERSNGKMA